jgi:hypothetical protein
MPRGNSRDTSDACSEASLPFGRKRCPIDQDNDMLALPDEAELSGPGMPPAPAFYRDARWLWLARRQDINVRIWEERVMRISSSLAAPSAVAILSIALLWSLTGPAMSETESRVAGVTSLPDIVVGAPRQLNRPKEPGHRAVARSTVSPRTSIASADDPPAYGGVAPATTVAAAIAGNCSVTTWPTVSPVQCTKPWAHSYVECTEMVLRNGSRPTDAWWWCSNQGFRN